MKTHLCGILVHGEGLYSDVWINSQHKHDSNQVITYIMNVIMMLEIAVEDCCPPWYTSKQIIAVERTRINTCFLSVLHLLDWDTLRRYI